ncbi:pentapeptide repeat-containing protein [Actinomadura sp. 9N407]|uniref:pentapeptide repeat-containing protein n=1 Tax=Actinomadura sp. 9N407 TaxID=3375154 RepID=UPI00379FDDCF
MLVLAVLLVLLWPVTAWWVEHVDGVKLHGRDALTGKDRQESLDKARGRITAMATGFLAAVAIYYTAANARSARETAKAAQESVHAALRAADHTEQAQLRTHELTERGQLTDRFTAAVAQLGDTNPAIQLGGVHALAGIADDASRTLRQTCIDVLCAYLRLPYTPDPGPLPTDQQTTPTAERDTHHQQRIVYRGLREVRHTILRLIGNHLRLPAEDPYCWQGHDFDFTDVVFDGGDLHGAHFTAGTANFTNATFANSFSFRNVTFSGGQVSFAGARFSGQVDFADAMFADGEVNFWGAMFSGGQVSFAGARFSGQVDFADAQFSGGEVNLVNATFSGGQVSFMGATFSGGQVSFRGAMFSGGQVSFVSATFSGGQVSFVGATFSDGKVIFIGATLSGSKVNFWGAMFSGGEVNFEDATFSDGQVNFIAAMFSGGEVSFGRALFTGGRVDVAAPRAWVRPPVGIPMDAEGRPPAGVSLPDTN